MAAKSNLTLSDEEKKTLLSLARQTLKKAFESDAEHALKDFLNSYPLRDCSLFEVTPCFVTLKTKDGKLRGCIGCTETHERLVDNVHIYTQLAAFRDPRFPEVEADELDDLLIHLSVLGPSRALPSLDEVVIGAHGLSVRKGLAHGVLLATVAVEYGWTPQQFLEHTYLKAGLKPDESGVQKLFFEQISFSEEDF